MRPITLVLAAALLSLPANLKAISLGFDDLAVGSEVANQYPGLTFSPGWIVGPPDAYGGAGNSAEVPSGGIIDIAGGWFGPVSFYYQGGPLTVDFFSLPGGTGTQVFSLSLPVEATFQPGGDGIPLFESMVFTSAGARIDVLTNGGFVIPEPGAFRLTLAGFVILILLRRRIFPGSTQSITR